MTKIGSCSELPVKETYLSPLSAQEADRVLGVSINIFFRYIATKYSSVLMTFDKTLDLED